LNKPSKLDEAREQFRIVSSSPYKENEFYEELQRMPEHLRKEHMKESIYVPRVEYCKFRPREEKED